MASKPKKEKMTAREIAAAVEELIEIRDECDAEADVCGGGRQEKLFRASSFMANVLSKMLKEKKWTH